jgi:hypothetical protein
MGENKKIYVDKVVEFLVKDTTIDRFGIWFPWMSNAKGEQYPEGVFKINFYYGKHRKSFYLYCRDVYGLTYPEVRYAWNLYLEKIKEVIQNSDTRHRNKWDWNMDYVYGNLAFGSKET